MQKESFNLHYNNITEAIDFAWKGNEKKTSVIFKNKKYTFQDLKNKAQIYQSIVKKLSNNKNNKRIVIISRNSPEIISLFLACGKEGWFCCPLNNELKYFQLSIQIKLINPIFIFYDQEIIKKSLLKDEDFHENLFIKLDSSEDNISLEKSKIVDSEILNEDFLLTCSSGSTGNPKPIVFTQKTKLIRSLMAIETWNLKPKDVFINASPLHHSLGQRLTFIPLLTGSKSILLEKFTVEEWLRESILHKVSFTIPVISHLQKLIQEKEFWDLISSKFFNCIVASSSKLDGDLRNKILRHDNNIFYEMYGTSEVGTATVLNTKLMNDGLDSVGKSVKNVNLKIINPKTKKQLKCGEIGEIAIDSIYRFKEYLNDKELTRKCMHGSYFLTGDLGYIDKKGFLYYKGRKDDCFNVGGIKTYSVDIENFVLENFELIDCKVFGLKHNYFGTIPIAACVTKEKDAKTRSALERKIRHLCALHLAPFQVPHLVVSFLDFPKLNNGKLNRVKLISDLEKRYLENN